MSSPTDERRVPAREGFGEVRERASRFLAFAARAPTPAEAEAFVDRRKRERHDATHVAFAWRIGSAPSESRRASDAGEPAGTAGKPILGAIESARLSDAVVAVVRYYGGTNLGTGGLVRAYRTAAERALAAAGVEVVYDTVRLEARCGYDRAGAVRRLLDPPAVRLIGERFDPEPVFEIEVRRSRLGVLAKDLEGLRIAVRPLDSGPEVPGPGAGRGKRP